MALTTHTATAAKGSSSTSPAVRSMAITPHDTNFLADAADSPLVTRGLSVNVAGTVTCKLVDDKSVSYVFYALAGVIYPLAVVKVFSTGTTATGIYGLF